MTSFVVVSYAYWYCDVVLLALNVHPKNTAIGLLLYLENPFNGF